GKMLSALKALEQQDPAQFQSVMTAIAGKLSAAAKSATHPGEQKTLTDLAAKFTAAGQSGDLSALAPPSGGASSGGTSSGPAPAGGPPGGGAPPSGGGGGGSSSSSSKLHDPADTNYDGKVSAKEAAAYREKLAAEKHVASGGTPSGSGPSTTSSSIVGGLQTYAGGGTPHSQASGALVSVQAIVEQALTSVGSS
ncbi:MAG TPA: hypothetical protein VK841_00040, partial [Polyangiaceae bacterium]|nr:hypothetical protein [Polyangiaceae bacterium]